MDNARSKALMANQRQTANQHLLDAKEHWRRELQSLHNFKKQIPKGSDVVNKLKIN